MNLKILLEVPFEATDEVILILKETMAEPSLKGRVVVDNKNNECLFIG